MFKISFSLRRGYDFSSQGRKKKSEKIKSDDGGDNETTTTLNRNSVTIEKRKETEMGRGNRGTGSYGTCGSSVSFVRVIATAKPQNAYAGITQEGEEERERDAARLPSWTRSRFWFATPALPIIAGGCFLGERDPSHLENNSIRLYRGLCERMTRISHEGGRTTFLRFVAYEQEDSGCGDGRLRWSWWADSPRNINPDCYAPSRSPNQFYLARVIASDLLDQPDE